MSGDVTHMHDAESVLFQCNICGTHSAAATSDFGRETASCTGCGSTVRMRAVVHLLSLGLFNRSLVIADFPQQPRYHGVGLSDWEEYARRLQARMDYTNTFYHREPRLDITDIPDERAGSCDFLISTDVFEHVLPPVDLAFSGAHKLLKPGGLFILTVPFSLDEDTVEHFPELHDFSIQSRSDGPVLVNRCRDGRLQTYDSLIFHGGPGETLEFRLFSRKAIERSLAGAGFTQIRCHDEPVPEFGIFWSLPWSLPITARA